MKKLTTFLLISLFLCLILTSCATSVPVASTAPSATPAPTETATPSATAAPTESPTIAESPKQVENSDNADYGSDKNTGLRFDGLYCRLYEYEGSLVNNAIRFYENGDVIDVSVGETDDGTPGFPKSSWFDINADNPNFSIGVYSYEGNLLSFATESEAGLVYYEGLIGPDYLLLDIYSYINGNESTGNEYFFIAFDDIKNWEN